MKEIKQGIKDASPVILGYIPVAITFGLLVKLEHLSLLEAILFSSVVFAGAAQFMAINAIHMGLSNPQIIVATFLMNLRHILMSTSIASRLEDDSKKYGPIIAFYVTDESYALTTHKKTLKHPYLLALQIANYLSWLTGTIIGYLIGEWVPQVLVVSMGIALYAMFAALLIPEIKKGFIAIILAVFAGGLNRILMEVDVLSTGWHFIVAVISSAALGSLIFRREACDE